MTAPLDRLVGMVLLDVAPERGTVTVQFSGCTLSAYSQTSSSRSPRSLIGRTVKAVAYTAHESLVIRFDDDDSFTLSLQPDDYIGPEAFCARFADGPWVVE